MNVCFAQLGETMENAGHVFKKKAVFLRTWPQLNVGLFSG